MEVPILSPYFIKWSLIFCYNKKEQQVSLVFSRFFIEQNELEIKDITIRDKNLEDLVHKYDYRKLGYFTKDKKIKVFDTLIRLKIPSLNKVLRTKAICRGDSKGFECVNFEEVELVKLRKTVKEAASVEINISVKIKNTTELCPKHKKLARDLKKPLLEFFDREIDISKI